MSNIDKRALRKAAMHAKTEDDWGCDADNFHDKATPDAVLALLDELEAAEKRIAELEARTVKLPEALIPAIHNSGEPFMRPEPFGLYLNRDDVLRALRAAGIGVKGE